VLRRMNIWRDSEEYDIMRRFILEYRIIITVANLEESEEWSM
jgi:hypothetical protein